MQCLGFHSIPKCYPDCILHCISPLLMNCGAEKIFFLWEFRSFGIIRWQQLDKNVLSCCKMNCYKNCEQTINFRNNNFKSYKCQTNIYNQPESLHSWPMSICWYFSLYFIHVSNFWYDRLLAMKKNYMASILWHLILF